MAQTLVGSKELSEHLLDLLDSISELPDVTDKDGNAITPQWENVGVYWRDMPEFAIMFREYTIDKSSIRGITANHKCPITGRQLTPLADVEDTDKVESGWDNQAVSLLNDMTFGAIYLAQGKQLIAMLFYAEISLMQGIKDPCQTPDKQRLAAMYVPPAATWIFLTGEIIYEHCKNDFNCIDGAPGLILDDDWLWGNGKGYSLGRWAFWKKRFGKIAMTQGLLDSVKDLATIAVSEMGKIES